MKAIAYDHWLPYVRPSFGSRPTVKMSAPSASELPDLSVAAREPKIFASHNTIDRIAAMPDDWDSHRSAAPNPYAVERARQFIEDAFRATEAVGWQTPYISASEDGEIAFEWWNGPRKLTIYVGPEQTTFLKSWGPHIVEDMTDGVLTQNWDTSLWAWLFK